jgi:dihydroneopterin aldolase
MDAPRIASSTRALRHVFLRDLVLSASIGVYPHEHAARQRVRINVDLGVEDDGARALSRARVGRDDLSRVVDYEKVAATVRGIVAAGHRSLSRRSAGSLGTNPGGKAGHIRRCNIGRRRNRAPAGRFVHALTARLTDPPNRLIVFNGVIVRRKKI